MSKTYWSHNGKHQAAADALQELVPVEGAVKNPKKNAALEKFRKASNCYYDLYNNGLCNRAREFAFVFFPAGRYKRGMGSYSEVMYDMVESLMDKIIERAAAEQGVAIHVEEVAK